MTPDLLRSIWKTIESIPRRSLTEQNNDAVVDVIIALLSESASFNPDQILSARTYLRNRMSLIHELSEDEHYSNLPYLVA